MINKKELKANIILLLVAAIWGFAFVAQRVGVKFIGPFMFNGIRFALGSISLIPLILINRKLNKQIEAKQIGEICVLKAGGIAGSVLFLAASLQQIGLQYTTAGKAGFITGLYIVLVPILGIYLKHKVNVTTWIAVILALLGLYFLSINENFTIVKGDIFEILGAIFWAIHILLIDNFTKKLDALKLSCFQFLTCSILSVFIGLAFEKFSFYSIYLALVPILYGGICSVGIAYTLQTIGQKYAKPSHAAIILSLESFFASLGGVIILKETLDIRGYLGCILMLFGMLLSQVQNFNKNS